MKKVIFGLVILVVFVFAFGALAQQKPAPVKPEETKAPAAPSEKVEKFRGVIENVDEATKTIEVKGRFAKQERALTFVADEKTKIKAAKKEIPFNELKKGMDVTVEYKKEGDKMVAVAIQEAVPKAATKK